MSTLTSNFCLGFGTDQRAMEHPKNPLLALMKQISDRSWLFAGRLVISETDTPADEHSWSNGKGVYYTIADAPHALPVTQDLPADGEVQLVYDAGGVSAVWALGNAYCKIKTLEPHTTREHVTLEYLQTRGPLTFAIPRVIYQREFDGLYCIVLSKVEGVILDEAWDEMDERMKQQCVSQVVNICGELATWHGERVSGVDGNYLSELYLSGKDTALDPDSLLKVCRIVGMDCSRLVFCHCDMGPGNIIVNMREGVVGIVDWETAGFVPKEWIRTKFRVSSGLNFAGDDQDYAVDWRVRVQRQLGEEGYKEVADEWMEWFNGKV
ncbi:hypothetical protein LTR56_015279 [Elasticomyces elasticus]|nr:hypothetical protein LTR56_015279 [Elasticomyces elasticus]KAK3640377.1 hypothetical protein LTR22_017034 [Elasticomyces elasticus]KAK4913627.1 hypothetical protein LTR49_018041 [Elasticomyces elasticus]KAK5753054.1 hypothetical protein LTS12_016834 [Elasticomyces elasticus]